jgi:hypothetical protein
MACQEVKLKLKKQTQGNGGSQKKLAADHRRMTRHVGVARPEGYCCQGHGRSNVVCGATKGRTLGRRYQPKLECKNGTRNRGLRQQLHLGSKRAFNKIVRKTFKLEFVNRIAGSSIRMQVDIVEGSAPSETEKETAHRVGAGNVGAPAILGSFASVVGKRKTRKAQDDSDIPGWTSTL